MTTDALELFLRYISAKWEATFTQIYPVLSQLAEFSEPEGVGERETSARQEPKPQRQKSESPSSESRKWCATRRKTGYRP